MVLLDSLEDWLYGSVVGEGKCAEQMLGLGVSSSPHGEGECQLVEA